jgi:hypothetical protein
MVFTNWLMRRNLKGYSYVTLQSIYDLNPKFPLLLALHAIFITRTKVYYVGNTLESVGFVNLCFMKVNWTVRTMEAAALPLVMSLSWESSNMSKLIVSAL